MYNNQSALFSESICTRKGYPGLENIENRRHLVTLAVRTRNNRQRGRHYVMANIHIQHSAPPIGDQQGLATNKNNELNVTSIDTKLVEESLRVGKPIDPFHWETTGCRWILCQ